MLKRKRLSETSPLSQETPKNEKSQTPKKRTPQLQTPKVKTPQSQTPKVKTPQSQTPKVKTPQSQTPKVKSPQSQTSKVKTPQSPKMKRLRSETLPSPDANGKQTEQNQKVTLTSPKITPKRTQNMPNEKKGTPYPKRIHEDDEDEDEDDEVVFNFNGINSSKATDEEFEEDDEDSDEEPVSKKAKTNILSMEDATGPCDAKSLFLKNLPPKCTVAQIKAWSKDILDVRLRVFTRLGKDSEKQQHMRCAYLEFENEAKADLNYKKLKGKKVDNKEIYVDYVGAKSSYKPSKVPQQVVVYDKKKLYVAGLSQEVTKSDLEELFPTSIEIVLPKTKKRQQIFGYSFISFENEADCKNAHDKMQNKTLKGSPLVVLYSRKRENEANKEMEKRTQGAASDEEDSSSDDDDDDDEDGDDDSDDEEEEMDTDDDDSDDDSDDDEDDDNEEQDIDADEDSEDDDAEEEDNDLDNDDEEEEDEDSDEG